MRVIGLNLSYNSSACAVSAEEGIIFAVSEERLTNEKNTKKFPINALQKAMEYVTCIGQEKVLIMVSSYEVLNMRALKNIEDLTEDDLACGYYETLRNYVGRKCNIPRDLITIKRVDHHDSHRLSAMLMSGFLRDKHMNTIAITYDGFGDGLCSTIYDCKTNEILGRKDLKHSLALVYQFVTGALGFKEHQHEGKITGLAAYGQPKYLKEFKANLIDYNSGNMSFVQNYASKVHSDFIVEYFSEFNKNIHAFNDFMLLKISVYELIKFLKGFEHATKEDIAATVQAYVEELLLDWLHDVLQGHDLSLCNIVLSGGLFANVKINMKIMQKLRPANLFVLPPMGDEGTCVGAAIRGCINLKGADKLNLDEFSKDVLYYGNIGGNMSFTEVQKAVEGTKYLATPVIDAMAITVIADFLKKGKIVCLSRHGSEFGPRALGNHSILYDAGQYETNKWLNDRLNRTEFMPFAPIVMDIFKKDLFEMTEGLDKTLKYMTITLPVTKEFKDNYKAAYHIDYTARPQIISYEDNPFTYSVLRKYHEISGKKALINTSFNIHNYPIIGNDKIAIESFMSSELDVLLLNNALIIKKELMFE